MSRFRESIDDGDDDCVRLRHIIDDGGKIGATNKEHSLVTKTIEVMHPLYCI